MKLDFNFDIQAIDKIPGFKIEGDKHAGRTLALTLCLRPEPINTLKYWGWAQTLAAGQPIEIDMQDAKTLRDFIQKQQIPCFTQAQLMEVIDKALTTQKS